MRVSIGNGTFHSCLHLKKSEAVGSNPTLSTFICDRTTPLHLVTEKNFANLYLSSDETWNRI